MTIKVQHVANPTHEENIIYDVHCLNCYDISKENGDFLERPLEIIGFEEHATFDVAMKEATEHDQESENHKVIVRGIDTGQMEKTFRNI